MSVLKTFERKAVDFLLEGKEVEGPKSKKMILITNAVNEMDEKLAAEEKGDVMANADHKVKLSENEMCNVAELMERHNALKEENARLKNELDEWDKATDDQDKDHPGNETEEEKKAREAKEAQNAKDQEEKEKKEKDTAQNKKLEAIRNKVTKLKNLGGNGGTALEQFSEENPQPEIRLTSARVRKPASQQK